jgi:hypothetical protein
MKTILLVLGAIMTASTMTAADKAPEFPMEIPVVSVSYFPVKGDMIDKEKTGDVGGKLSDLRKKVSSMEADALKTLTDGTRYRGYKNSAVKPAMNYTVVKRYEFLEPLPTYKKSGEKTPYTDYKAILKRINAKDWVENKGVKEIWIWGYHGGVVVLWESNMGSPYGDISNSNRDQDDLPLYDKTYTVYHYNYGRSANEAVHNHLHQIEHLINHVDGRHLQPKDKWDELLFWGKFVGSDYSHKLINPGVGWCHYPPNAIKDYEYHSPRKVESDMLDWKPDRSGKKTTISNATWDDTELKFYLLWLQCIPGMENELEYKGKKLNNWWVFKGDWDYVMKNRIGLVKGVKPKHITGKKRK